MRKLRFMRLSGLLIRLAIFLLAVGIILSGCNRLDDAAKKVHQSTGSMLGDVAQAVEAHPSALGGVILGGLVLTHAASGFYLHLRGYRKGQGDVLVEKIEPTEPTGSNSNASFIK